MSIAGFGSPTFNPPPTINDVGFGDPSTPNVRDTGFGAPLDGNLMSPEILADISVIGDDGGERLDIAGHWYMLSSVPVPAHAAFTVHYIHTVTNTVTPALSGYLGDACYTNPAQTILHAYVPPLAHGTYDLRITHPAGVITIDDAFRVVTRTRSPETYGMRRSLPSFYATGARAPQNETLSELPTYTFIEAFTRSVGQVVQRFASNAFVLVTQNWDEGDGVLYVESTLNFDPSGAVLVNGYVFTYTSKQDDRFIGVTPVQRISRISAGAKVVQHVTN